MLLSISLLHSLLLRKTLQQQGFLHASLTTQLLQVFVPSAHEAAHDDDFSLEQTAPVRLMYILITLTLGWPMYMVANVSGRPYDRWANHFDPYSPIFSKRERVEVKPLSSVARLCSWANTYITCG